MFSIVTEWCSHHHYIIPEHSKPSNRGFPGGPVVRMPSFHCRGKGLISGRGTLHAVRCSQREKRKVNTAAPNSVAIRVHFPLHCPPQGAGNHCGFACSGHFPSMEATLCRFLWLVAFTEHSIFKVHSWCNSYQYLFPFYCQIVFHPMATLFFFYPFQLMDIFIVFTLEVL